MERIGPKATQRLKIVLDLVIWFWDREKSCGGGVNWFLLVLFWSARREISNDEVLDCTRPHTVVRAPNTPKATECCGYLSDFFIHLSAHFQPFTVATSWTL
jgi:hypothetical protein